MLRSRSFAFVIGCALLASCGGDGGSSPPPTSGGGGGGGTPAPSPAPTYQTFAQLTGSQTFATTCGGNFNFFGASPIAVGGIRLDEGVTIVSDRSQPTYAITGDGTGMPSFSTTFTQAHRNAGQSGESYAKPSESGSGFIERFSIFALTQNNVELPYIRVAQIVAEAQAPSNADLLCALGVPTQPTDRPTTTVTYNGLAIFGTAMVTQNVGAGPTESYRISSSSVTLVGNPNNGQISFTLTLRGQLVTGGTVSSTITELGTFTGTTTFDGTTQGYSDLILDSNNTVAGTFGGGFFGPQGGTAAVTIGLQNRRADDSDLSLGALFVMRPQ